MVRRGTRRDGGASSSPVPKSTGLVDRRGTRRDGGGAKAAARAGMPRPSVSFAATSPVVFATGEEPCPPPSSARRGGALRDGLAVDAADAAVPEQEDGVLGDVLLGRAVAVEAGVEAAQEAAGDAVADGDDAAFGLRRQVGQPRSDTGADVLVGLAGRGVEGPAGAPEGLGCSASSSARSRPSCSPQLISLRRSSSSTGRAAELVGDDPGECRGRGRAGWRRCASPAARGSGRPAGGPPPWPGGRQAR